MFDDKTKQALHLLMENYWILRDADPESYEIIREQEEKLKTYLMERLGYRLVLHRYYAKIDKVPLQPMSWMGIEKFTQPLDYAMFCGLLAFLESKEVDEQFLLPQFIDELKMYLRDVLYVQEEENFWYLPRRRALIRAMQFAADMGLVRVYDGDIENFTGDEHYEVLYQVRPESRYFMRSIPIDITPDMNPEDLLEAEWRGTHPDPTTIQKQRIRRHLFLSPVVHPSDLPQGDYALLQEQYHLFMDDMFDHTDFQIEVYKDCAMLTCVEQNNNFTLYPFSKNGQRDGITLVAVLFAKMLSEKEPITHLRLADFERLMGDLREQTGFGWSKACQEKTDGQLVIQLLELLRSWRFALPDPYDSDLFMISPSYIRTVGEYPVEFTEKIGRMKRNDLSQESSESLENAPRWSVQLLEI